ncbi:hypothetical protein ACFQZC_34860 [Streptacidiphilus monticola]
MRGGDAPRPRALATGRTALHETPQHTTGPEPVPGTAPPSPRRRRARRGRVARPRPTPALAATQSPADAGGTSTYDASAAQQQRQDECLLSTVLRLGGPAMKQVAAQGLDGDPAALHAAAAADYWDTTPLSTAYKKDHDAQSAKLDELAGRHTTWEQPLASLVVPNAGFSSVADFRWAPNPGFFDTVGLSPWVAQQFWASESAVYADPTPLAGKTSADAATALGNALYPEPTNGNDPNFEREYNEWRAWQDMTFMHGLFADDTRLLLEGGGFPAPRPTRARSSSGSPSRTSSPASRPASGATPRTRTTCSGRRCRPPRPSGRRRSPPGSPSATRCWPPTPRRPPHWRRRRRPSARLSASPGWRTTWPAGRRTGSRAARVRPVPGPSSSS